MKKFFIIGAAAFMAVMGSGCDQRDLYVKVGPLIYVQGDWMPSLGKNNMYMDATGVSYSSGDGSLYTKQYFYNPNYVELPADKGTYDVMIFNGLMYSESDTHLDNIFFRGTGTLDTFEAVAAEGSPNRRLSRADGEYIASNEMEIMTSATERDVEIHGKDSYYVKYKNGKNGFDIPVNYVETELYLTPQAVNYYTRVTVTITNITSAFSASAALYGFVGSAFLADRMPSHFYVTHQFNLNHKQITDKTNDIGTIQSPDDMVTFGPPLDAPGHKYEVYIKITMVNLEVWEDTFDVTDQVTAIITKLANNRTSSTPEYMINIPINISIDLPYIEPVEGLIDVGQWDDDEIIRVPIKQ